MKQFTSTLLMLFTCVYLYAQPGTLYTGFNPTGTPGYTINDIDGQGDFTKGMAIKSSDGSIYVTGWIQGASDDSLFISHYLNNGTLDLAFGGNGTVRYRFSTLTTHSNAIGLQSDGTVVVAGWTYASDHNFFVARFDGTSGALKSTVNTDFGGIDEVNALIIQSDDKIVVAGFGTASSSVDQDMIIARYTADGSMLDNTFNPSPALTPGYIVQNITGADVAKAIAIDKTSSDIIVAGTSNSGNANSDFAILRLTSTGGFVNSFDFDGIKTQNIINSNHDEGNAVAIDANGNIVVAGTTSTGGNPDIALIRLSAAGVLDPGFNTTGTPGIVVTDVATFHSNEGVSSVAIQNDNKIVVGGGTDGSGGPTFDFMLVRYIGTGVNAGTLDGNFGAGLNGIATGSIGANVTPTAMLLSGNKIYAVANTQSTPNVVLAVFNNDAVALPLVLSSFYAQKQTNKVVLQWQTSSEEGVKQFVIERSTDGKTYKSIGQVAASGNGSLTKNYSFADQSPYMSTSNYYRLNMQDIDGAIKYSKILIIKFDGQLTTSMAVFPNPTRDLLQVQLPDGMNGSVGLQVFDLNGRLVKFTHLASDGSALNTTVDVSTLVSGIYILKAQAGNVTLTSRFIKK
ncbi:MAG: T9SS type A sorting domain-containing protein [Niastella sp.]|uniref:T9SS type A sorting domain-containing protein n=1 Tax=Niastella sp. TaxID=1869183 RepID=UPI003899988A